MSTLESLIKEIPGLDASILDPKVKPYKQSICDPIVITGTKPQGEKFCAPTVPGDKQKQDALNAELAKTQRLVSALPTDIEHKFQQQCTTDYVAALTDFINNDVLPKNNSIADEISKIPNRVTDFWASMVTFTYYYAFMTVLHTKSVISDDFFNSLAGFAFLDNASKDEVSMVYKEKLKPLVQNLTTIVANTLNTEAIKVILDDASSSSRLRRDTVKVTITKLLGDDIAKINALTDNRIAFSVDNNFLIAYNINQLVTLSSGLIYDASNIHPVPSTEQIASGNYSTGADKSMLNGIFDTFFNSLCPVVVEYAITTYASGTLASSSWDSVIAATTTNTITSLYNQLLSSYSSMDSSSMHDYIKNKINSMKVCGQTIPDESDTVEPDTSTKDLNYNTYSGKGQPDFTKLKYWKAYSSIINLVGLLPAYWRVGLLIPTPSGLLKIPVPIVWIPLQVITTPLMTIVVFLTIDGMIICPTVWALLQKPLSSTPKDAESKHLALFRGANQTIKMDTGVTTLNLPVVKGININPALSRTLPFEKDDLPSIERVVPTNPLLLVYVNQWLSKAVSYMGIP